MAMCDMCENYRYDEDLEEYFCDIELDEDEYLKLRLLTIELDNGQKEFLLTNLFDKRFDLDDFKELYRLRWGIETNYNTLKNRLNIENYTGKRRITIEQDIYSQFLRYNIFQYYENYLNLLINKIILIIL